MGPANSYRRGSVKGGIYTLGASNKGAVVMIGVPKLSMNQLESEESLINKIVHWIKDIRKCYIIVHSDVLGDSRHSHPEGTMDYINSTLKNTYLMNGLLVLKATLCLQSIQIYNSNQIFFLGQW